MPHHKSQAKSLRQDAKRRNRNRAVMSEVRTMKKKVRSASSAEEASAVLPKAISVIDRAAKKGVIKKRTADRNKSRLSKFANSIGAEQ